MSKYEGRTPGDWEAAIVDHDEEPWIGVGLKGQEYPGMGVVVALCGPCGGKKEADSIADAALIADAPDLAHRIERALNRLRYMQSGSMAIAPSAADIGRLIKTLEGEE